ncbi:MAG: hypothetical protein JWP03_3747 [Phycisphaerales bacterium]|nr:hypothetical protein [Phycisphaerales bacterium]
MIHTGEYILVDSDEAQRELPVLLQAVMSGRRVRITQDGKIIAELLPASLNDEVRLENQRRARVPLGSNPLLKATFNGDPVQLTTAEDWPEELRANVAPTKPAE